MNDFALARVLHVLAVVLWIGGVAMVTTVLLPAVARMKTGRERIEFFERVEQRFAWQARGTTLVTGVSGFYMVHILNAWGRFAQPDYWWMHAMVLVWVVFTLMLFVLEPLVLHRYFLARAGGDADGTFAIIQRLHWGLLTISLLTVAGAVAGSHGWLLFWAETMDYSLLRKIHVACVLLSISLFAVRGAWMMAGTLGEKGRWVRMCLTSSTRLSSRARWRWR